MNLKIVEITFTNSADTYIGDAHQHTDAEATLTVTEKIHE